jgi:hypothetical protein
MLSFYEQTTDNNTLSTNPMRKEQNSTKNQSNNKENSLKRAMEKLITRRKLHGCTAAATMKKKRQLGSST